MPTPENTSPSSRLNNMIDEFRKRHGQTNQSEDKRSALFSNYLEIKRYITNESFFDFESDEIKEDNLAPLIRDHLVLIGEDWPNGQGQIMAFYDPQSSDLLHLYVARVINDEENFEQLALALRFSPQESPLIRFDEFWPPGKKTPALNEQVPPDHRVIGMTVLVPGEELVLFAQRHRKK